MIYTVVQLVVVVLFDKGTIFKDRWADRFVCFGCVITEAEFFIASVFFVYFSD